MHMAGCLLTVIHWIRSQVSEVCGRRRVNSPVAGSWTVGVSAAAVADVDAVVDDVAVVPAAGGAYCKPDR